MVRWIFALALLAVAQPSRATSHLWRITEIFSDASGQVQFVELKESTGDDHEWHLKQSEMFLRTLYQTWYFPHDLTPPTGHRYMLIATPAFAALPGAPAPDYLIDEELLPLFLNDGFDIINFGNEQNSFSSKILSPGMLPLDGTNSLHFTVDYLSEPTVGPASPTNFAGEAGSITVPIDSESFGEVKAEYKGEER